MAHLAALENLARVPWEALELAQRFEAGGHELALVGGTVRDLLLGRRSADLDFATSARPDATEALCRQFTGSVWDIGRDFGTIGATTAARDGTGTTTLEITTFRTDAYHPHSRKPGVAFGDSLEEDLSRRDFTVNAMAVRLPEQVFVDPFDGLSDLGKGIIRTPVAPEISFGDDPLRMLRAARFVAQLGFRIEPITLAAMCEMAPRIEIVSAERVQGELTKLLLADYPVAGLEILVESGLADHILPELPALSLEMDEHHRHKDVYQHSLQVLRQAMDLETDDDGAVPRPDLTLRLAALLHDAGKPATRRFERGGNVSFHGHDVVGARIVRKRLRALRYDKATTDAVTRLIELHLRFHGYGGASGWTDSAVRRYVTDAGPLLERLNRLTRADCTTRNQRKADALWAAMDELEVRVTALRQQERLDAIRPDLDGDEIMALLGIKPGRAVGEAYRYLLAERMEHGPGTKADAGAKLQAWWAARSSS